MPVPFQVGLFLTVLVMACVRFERSLREVFRSGAPGRLVTGSGCGSTVYGEGRGARVCGRGRGGSPPASIEPSGAFNWGRWYHLAILWGLVLFCVPFLLGVAFPGRIMEASKAADRRLTGGGVPTEIEIDGPGGRDVPGLAARPSMVSSPQAAEPKSPSSPERVARAGTGEEELGRRGLSFAALRSSPLRSTSEERTARAKARLQSRSEETEHARWTAFAAFAAAAAVLVALGAAARVARRLGRPALMTALAGVAFAGSGAAFAFAGPISSRLAGARAARRVIEEYARAPTVRVGANAPENQVDVAAWAGPVKLVGRISRPGDAELGDAAAAEPGYLYFRGPLLRHGAGEDDFGRTAPYAGFLLGAPGSDREAGGEVVVRAVTPPATPEKMRVVLPHVRLGHDGRKVFIRDDEDVLVIGYILSGSISPEPGYPVIVAPADAVSLRRGGLFRALAADLLGRGPRRARYLVLLQLLFGALGAWSLTVFCSGLCEYLVTTTDRRRVEGRSARSTG